MAIGPADHLVQVSLQTKSLLTKDRVVNTFAVKNLGTYGDYTGLQIPIVNFYKAMDDMMGSSLTLGGHTLKVYELSAPEPRPPVHEATFSVDSISPGGTMPNEVALVSSFSAAPLAGVSQARRRGRIFFGPLSSTTGVVAADGYVRPTTTAMNNLVDRFETMVIALETQQWPLHVWSRANSTLYPVVSGWVNNEFDTQRRRGPEETSRIGWSLLT